MIECQSQIGLKFKKLIDRIKNSKIHENNKRLLLDFYKELVIIDYSEARIHELFSHLVKIVENFPSLDLEKATKEDIKDILLWVQQRGTW